MRKVLHLFFAVTGRPVGWQRAGRNGSRYFTRPETARYQDEIRYAFLEEAQRNNNTNTPYREADYVTVRIFAYFKAPRSWSRKKKQDAYLKPYPQKPDADNVSKSVLDALNGVAWKDDKQVYDLRITKKYGEAEGIVVDMDFWFEE